MLTAPNPDGRTPAVSVIIVNFNAAATLPACLAAVRRQSHRPARVIVVDNASADGSLAAARAAFPEFEYLCLPENVGFAAANNRAIAVCATEFVALLNPDAYPEPDWLAELLAAARALPEAASFGSCQLQAGEEEVLDGIGDICHVSGLVWREGHGRLRGGADGIGREIFSPCAAAALYRRAAIIEAGGFDEDFFCYVEDVDLGFRLRLAGWKSWYVPAAVVRHTGSVTTGGARSDFAVYHGHRNLVWMYVKNMPGWLFWALMPAHLIMNLLGIAVFMLRGQGPVILKAKRDALRGLLNAFRKRSFIQQRRKLSASALGGALNKKLFPGRHRRVGKDLVNEPGNAA